MARLTRALLWAGAAAVALVAVWVRIPLKMTGDSSRR